MNASANALAAARNEAAMWWGRLLATDEAWENSGEG